MKVTRIICDHCPRSAEAEAKSVVFFRTSETDASGDSSIKNHERDLCESCRSKLLDEALQYCGPEVRENLYQRWGKK